MSFLTLDRKKSLVLALLLAQVLSCIPYGFLPSGPGSFPFFFGVYSLQFMLFGVCLWTLRAASVDLKWIVGLAILARAILLFTEPVMEDDFWRYLWDGRVLAHGFNPYAYKPLDPALDALDVAYRHHIGWKQYGTIYPPFSIYVFAISHLLARDSLFFLKTILAIFDLGTGFLVIEWLKERRTSIRWSVLYFFNPLLLKEIANSAHLDSIAVFFSIAAGLLLVRSENGAHARMNSRFAWGFLAVAVASKLYPICLVPLFLKLDRRSRRTGFVLFSAALLFLYVPVFFAGPVGLNGTEAFARQWIFNAGLFRILQKVAEDSVYLYSAIGSLNASTEAMLLKNDLLAKILAGTAFIFFAAYRVLRASSLKDLPSEVVMLLGALLLLSPVVNAWYVLWILPFACITRNVPWLVFSYLVVASYCWWYSPDAAFYMKWTEYVTFFVLLAIFGRVAKTISPQTKSA